MKENFSSRLKEFMAVKNITQQQLAEALDVKQGRVSQWLSDVNLPSYENLVKIANFFDVSLDILTGRKDY